MSARDSFVELGYEVRDHKLLELPEPYIEEVDAK